MIVYSKIKENLLSNIHNDIEEIENIKALYQGKLKVFRKYLINLNEKIQKVEEKTEEVSIFIELLYSTENNLKYFRKQIKKCKRKKTVLFNIENDIDKINEIGFENRINQYNQSYNNFKKEIIEHSIFEEQLTLQYLEKNIFSETVTYNNNDFVKKEDAELEEIKIEENIVEDNNTLLISEIQNKVILPYKGSEVKEILTSDENDYNDIQTIIDEKYTVPLVYYRNASISRYRETIKLMREKEKASLFDSIDLALELMKKRYVHPAIITACKNSDQLDVYLDCLDTNELDDFPFFEIKFELYPVKVKTKEFDFEDVTSKKDIWGFFKKIMPKRLQELLPFTSTYK